MFSVLVTKLFGDSAELPRFSSFSLIGHHLKQCSNEPLTLNICYDLFVKYHQPYKWRMYWFDKMKVPVVINNWIIAGQIRINSQSIFIYNLPITKVTAIVKKNQHLISALLYNKYTLKEYTSDMKTLKIKLVPILAVYSLNHII